MALKVDPQFLLEGVARLDALTENVAAQVRSYKARNTDITGVAFGGTAAQASLQSAMQIGGAGEVCYTRLKNLVAGLRTSAVNYANEEQNNTAIMTGAAG
jgi:hypothetical protein